MKLAIKDFGKLPDGRDVKLFEFETISRLKVSISNFGGLVTSIKMPDRNGVIDEITTGFDNLQSYVIGHPHFGAIAGRFANRIAGSEFTINGRAYSLPANNGRNHLHGGPGGFHSQLWDYKVKQNDGEAILVLSYTSRDGEEGYPGNLETNIICTLTDKGNDLSFTFEAKTDKPTHVNLTNHNYYNLGGFKSLIYDHELRVSANHYIAIDEESIPTGKLIPVAGSLFDLTRMTKIENPVKEIPGGIDHCFVLNHNGNYDIPVSELQHSGSGRKMTVYTTQPGLQVYSGNSLDGSYTGHNGTTYIKHSAICLETQHFPDTPNQPSFPSTLIQPGEIYLQKARFVFDILS